MPEISAKYERLIQDLRADFRPQREWGEGRGLFLVIGHFLVGVAAGAWLFGLTLRLPARTDRWLYTRRRRRYRASWFSGPARALLE